MFQIPEKQETTSFFGCGFRANKAFLTVFFSSGHVLLLWKFHFFLFTHVTCRRCQHYFLLFLKAFPNSVDLGIVQNHDNDEIPKLIGCKANIQRPVTCLKAPFRVEKISPPLNVTLKNEFPKQILLQDMNQDMSLLGFRFHDQILGVYCFR